MTDKPPRRLMFEVRAGNGDLRIVTDNYPLAMFVKRPADYIAEAYYVRVDKEATR